jgi:hypothetical protein
MVKMNIHEWAMVNKPSEEMHYERAFWEQIQFIRNITPSILMPDIPYDEARDRLVVISTHGSKSITLPVVEIRLPEVTLTIRNNFYDWKVSVDSSFPIMCDFLNLFDQGKEWTWAHCEGFESSRIHGCYKNSKRKFTVELQDNFQMYTFMYILAQYLKN